jgi:hypothetical protein
MQSLYRLLKDIIKDERRRSERLRERNLYIREYYPKTIGNQIRRRQ